MLSRTICAATVLAIAGCAEPVEPSRGTAAATDPNTVTLADLASVPADPPPPEAEPEFYEGYLWGLIWDARERSGPGAPSADYPVVLTDVASQRALGLMVTNYGPYAGEPALTHDCYYYGDGGTNLSLSEEFLATYRAQGFSRETLCMALVSSIRFNPETGARLATVQMADIEELSRPDYFGEPGPISEEIPLQIPACFRRGMPLVDCRFAYDPLSGARLTAEETARIAAAGSRAHDEARALLAAGKYARPCGAGDDSRPANDESCYDASGTGREYRISANHPAMLPLGGFYAFSPDFEEGFAYAIIADGAAGPSAEMDSVQLALGGKNRASRAKLEALKIASKSSQ